MAVGYGSGQDENVLENLHKKMGNVFKFCKCLKCVCKEKAEGGGGGRGEYLRIVLPSKTP